MNSRNFLALAVLAALSSNAVSAQTKPAPPPEPEIDWQPGPVKAPLGDQAELALPKGFVFADPANSRKFLERTHNIPNGNELGIIAPVKGDWFAIFEFDPVGYVKDDEKSSLDAAAIFDSIKKGNDAGNEERRKRGWGTFTITGWIDPPHYDNDTHQLTWAFVGEDEKGLKSANYRTRLLGRRGVMSVELVVSPEELNAVLPQFRQAATAGYTFTSDNTYSSYVKGDKVAEYGLSALIVGGAAAAAVKMGFFKYIGKFLIVGWKFIVIGFGALFGVIKKFFSGIFSRKPADPEPGTLSE